MGFIKRIISWFRYRKERRQEELSEEVSQLLDLDDEYDYADYDQP